MKSHVSFVGMRALIRLTTITLAILWLCACHPLQQPDGRAVTDSVSPPAVTDREKRPIPGLPPGSRIVSHNGVRFHVRELGREHRRHDQHQANGPTLLLLSGPTDHWHADSAWWARAQPILAERFHTIAIDRPDAAWSYPDAPVGYLSFVDQVLAVIEQQNLSSVLILAYASSNLTVHGLASRWPEELNMEGVVLIDPDVLQPHSIAQYSNDAKPFREKLQEYIDFIQAGKYDERAKQINAQERQQVAKLIGSEEQQRKAETAMDWHFFDAVLAQRLTTTNLVNKLRTVAQYQDDLEQATAIPFPNQWPLVIIDSDFENAYIMQNPEKTGLVTWKEEGETWFKRLAQLSVKGRYLPLTGADHLVPIEHPQVIIDAVDWLISD